MDVIVFENTVRARLSESTITLIDDFVYADIAQRINLEIFRRFESEGIDFAYPSRTLYMQRTARHHESSLA